MGILDRCYNPKSHIRVSSYADCYISENFKNFQYFAEWCNDQIGFSNEGWQLDKDILSKGNRVYSEYTCVFVPSELNGLLINNKACRGKYPIGVTCSKKTGEFIARININGRRINLGSFITSEEAFKAYKQAKERHIKVKATKYRDSIDVRAYEALLDWQIDPDD